jgi:hypothetical protein
MTTLPSLTCAAVTLLAWPLVHGCTELELGAVEVSWDLRTVDGSGVDCGPAGVATIDLFISDDLGEGVVAFPCEDERGVTRFDLAPGEVTLWLAPGCEADTPPGAYRAPAPIVRTITAGEVITLDTQLIEVEIDVTCP